MYLTEVHATTEADIFFPDFDGEDWVDMASEEYEADAKNYHLAKFEILELRK